MSRPPGLRSKKKIWPPEPTKVARLQDIFIIDPQQDAETTTFRCLIWLMTGMLKLLRATGKWVCLLRFLRFYIEEYDVCIYQLYLGGAVPLVSSDR